VAPNKAKEGKAAARRPGWLAILAYVVRPPLRFGFAGAGLAT
jgi:hypothetical protein